MTKPKRRQPQALHPIVRRQLGPQPTQLASPAEDASQLEHIPVSFNELTNYYNQFAEARPFDLRLTTLHRIEQITNRPLICYVTKTHNIPQGIPAYIEDSDLVGFSDLIHSVEGKAVDVFLVSNGGSAEATERIVRLLRERFDSVRFVIPANAYSAATLLSFSGDEVIMGEQATLGPIDPQLNGIPTRAILRAFETLQDVLKQQGPSALTAYMPLIMKYDLHILEMCRSAEELSKELAQNWLSTYMLKGSESSPVITAIIEFFSSYDVLKSHGRSIDRTKARELGLRVVNVEDIEGLADLMRSLYNQYELWFDKTSFYKDFENAHGISWGRQSQSVTLQIPFAPLGAPQPGPPQRAE